MSSLTNLSQSGFGKAVRTGELWTIEDEKIVFPDTLTNRERDLKESRLVLVLQKQSDLDALSPIHLLIVPLSSKNYKNRWDYPIDLIKNPNSNLKLPSFLRLNHIQPVCKGDLGRRIGNLELETLQEVTIKIMDNTGLLALIQPEEETKESFWESSTTPFTSDEK